MGTQAAASTLIDRPRAASRNSHALAILGLGAFTVGTSELVVVGILDQIAGAAGVSIAGAGTLVTAARRLHRGGLGPAARMAGRGRRAGRSRSCSAAQPCRRRIDAGAIVGGQVAAQRGVSEVAVARAAILCCALPAAVAARWLRPASGA